MGNFRVQLGFPLDSALPRDVITINPHFSGADAEALVVGLKANLDAWAPTAGKPYTIKVYDAAKAPPSYPLTTRTNAGTIPNTTNPREIALCLSYYAGNNRPSYRGRLYLPNTWSAISPGLRPTTQQRDAVIDFGKKVLIANLSGIASWIVWSAKLKQNMGVVTNMWVDDEWDTVRSRGLKATTRTLATVP